MFAAWGPGPPGAHAQSFIFRRISCRKGQKCSVSRLFFTLSRSDYSYRGFYRDETGRNAGRSRAQTMRKEPQPCCHAGGAGLVRPADCKRPQHPRENPVQALCARLKRRRWRPAHAKMAKKLWDLFQDGSVAAGREFRLLLERNDRMQAAPAANRSAKRKRRAGGPTAGPHYGTRPADGASTGRGRWRPAKLRRRRWGGLRPRGNVTIGPGARVASSRSSLRSMRSRSRNAAY